MTRTFNHLYPQIYDPDNLWLAWRRARRGGKRKWASVAAFEVDLEQNLWALHDELRDKSYQPGPYRHFYIQEPKPRRISAAPFRDRVVAPRAHAGHLAHLRGAHDPRQLCVPGRQRHARGH